MNFFPPTKNQKKNNGVFLKKNRTWTLHHPPTFPPFRQGGGISTPDPDDPQSSEHGLHAMLIVGYNDRQEVPSYFRWNCSPGFFGDFFRGTNKKSRKWRANLNLVAVFTCWRVEAFQLVWMGILTFKYQQTWKKCMSLFSGWTRPGKAWISAPMGRWRWWFHLFFMFNPKLGEIFSHRFWWTLTFGFFR